jgi:hypothetical protein
LPIVLVVCVVLALVVVALAKYAAGTLRFGQEVEASADRLAAAQGGMDNALEAIERGTSDCVTETIQNGNTVEYTMATPLNAIQPVITCTPFGGDVTPVDAYAVIMTGANGQSGPLLTVTNAPSEQKVFEGRVFMNGAPDVDTTIQLSSDLWIKNGIFKYLDPECDDTVDLGGHPKEITLSTGYITSCSEEGWEQFLLLKPAQPSTASFAARSNTTTPNTAGCSVWLPGRYDAAPVLGEYNYFASGEYFFNNVGKWAIKDAFVLAGWPGATGPDIENNKVNTGGNPDHSINWNTNPCNSAANDPDESHAGAAFYMGGNSKIELQANSSLEISGFLRDGYNIGVAALEGGALASNLTGEDRIVSTDSGNQKQLSVQGLVWAPYTGLEFQNVANETVAALTGGAVVSELAAGAAANTNNFTIAVQTQPQVLSLIVTSAATNTGTTTVRTQITYRTDGTTSEYAILSRRIIKLTAE